DIAFRRRYESALFQGPIPDRGGVRADAAARPTVDHLHRRVRCRESQLPRQPRCDRASRLTRSGSYCELVAAERVDVSTAQEMWRAGDPIIDVRSPSEYAQGHIAGALNVPLDTLPLGARKLPDGPILTACGMGGRAGRAAELLDLAGRTAFFIAGGTKAWAAAGLPVVVGPEPEGPADQHHWFRRRRIHRP